MGFPDRIERTVQLAHPPAQVWAALTSAEGLGTWFGDQATVDLRPGGSARLTWTGGDAFTWPMFGLPDDDPRRTYVEFTLEPAGAGTRLTVVETGFAQLPDDTYRKVFEGNTQGWATELGELVSYLDAA